MASAAQGCLDATTSGPTWGTRGGGGGGMRVVGNVQDHRWQCTLHPRHAFAGLWVGPRQKQGAAEEPLPASGNVERPVGRAMWGVAWQVSCEDAEDYRRQWRMQLKAILEREKDSVGGLAEWVICYVRPPNADALSKGPKKVPPFNICPAA